MMYRIIGALAAVLSGVTAARADGLAEKLPGNTVFYAEADVERLAESARRAIRFVDPDIARGLESDLSSLLEIGKEIAGAYEFDPSLIDRLIESKLYFVILPKNEPVSRTVMRSEFSYNQETRTFEEKKVPHTVVDAYTESFIVEIGEDAAEGLLSQLKGFLERQDMEWREFEVDEGELIGPPDEAKRREEPETIGRRGSYLVWANGEPKELWQALASRPEPSFAESPLYRRYKGGEGGSLGLMLANLQELISDSNSRQGKGQRLPIETIFETFVETLDLDKVEMLGMNMPDVQIGERLSARGALDLRLESEPSPAIRHLLDGGHEFEVPPMGELDDLGIFLRTGIAELLRTYVESLGQGERQGFEQAMAMMKSLTGYTAPEIVEQLAGDLYIFMDVTEQEVETYDFNRDTEEVETKTEKMFLPSFSVLLGLKDREVFANMLSTMITRLSSSSPLPITQFMQKRVYQGEDVYVFGLGAEEMKDPDGLQSFALVLADRYLTVGSWREATALVRRAKAAEEGRSRELTSVLASHPDASLLLVAPREFVKKAEKLDEEGADPAKLLQQGIAEIEAGLTDLLGDEELSGRLKEVLERVAKKVRTLDEKTKALSVYPQVVHGKLNGNTYEVRIRQDLRKP